MMNSHASIDLDFKKQVSRGFGIKTGSAWLDKQLEAQFEVEATFWKTVYPESYDDYLQNTLIPQVQDSIIMYRQKKYNQSKYNSIHKKSANSYSTYASFIDAFDDYGFSPLEIIQSWGLNVKPPSGKPGNALMAPEVSPNEQSPYGLGGSHEICAYNYN